MTQLVVQQIEQNYNQIWHLIKANINIVVNHNFTNNVKKTHTHTHTHKQQQQQQQQKIKLEKYIIIIGKF